MVFYSIDEWFALLSQAAILSPLFKVLQHAANDAKLRASQRSRTVPLPHTIMTVPGYPSKLSVFKMAASRFWQVRCWLAGRTHRRSTRTESLREAQSYARQFYELLLVQYRQGVVESVGKETIGHTIHVRTDQTFGVMAGQMFANEQARSDRGEFSKGSVQVLRNRLDAQILPRWANVPIAEIDYQALLAFVQVLSTSMSTITVSQYLVVVRKVLLHAIAVGALVKLPQFPKIKIITTSRGAFTPSEYWRIIRAARRLRDVLHPKRGSWMRQHYKLRFAECRMPRDLAWAIAFMVNSFIRPSDLKTLKHRHVEVVRSGRLNYLRLTLPATKMHGNPIVTLQPAVRIYQQICEFQKARNCAGPDDYLFLPDLVDRNYAQTVLNCHLNWVLDETGLKNGANGQARSMYSFRHSCITFRLLYGQGIDLLTLARNARTSVEMLNNYYASTLTGEQNIGMLQSRRSRIGA